MNCIDCGKKTIGRAKRCEACREKYYRNYHREYYANHRAALREQIRACQKSRKKAMKEGGRRADFVAPRLKIQDVYTIEHINQASPEKAERIFNQILSGDRGMAGVR